MNIRPFTPEDYPALVAVNTAAFPDYEVTVAEARHHDKHRDPKCTLERWIAETTEGVAAVGEYRHSSSMYHPRKFWVDLKVLPQARRRGIGTTLWAHLMSRLEPSAPLSIRAGTREDLDDGIRFLQQRGFVETMREWESRLDVAAFDPAPFAAAAAKAQSHGIEIKTLRELEGDPEREQKLHGLCVAIEGDVPRPEPEYTPCEFGRWVKRFRDSPNLLPDGYFVAVHQGEYVGLSQLWRLQATDHLDTGLTGVLQEYRRQGIALALKLRAVDYARQSGVPVIRTWNEVNNRAMLSINEALGFAKQPAWVDYLKVLREEE